MQERDLNSHPQGTSLDVKLHHPAIIVANNITNIVILF